MIREVPFLPDTEIEREANLLLRSFGLQRNWDGSPPVPIEDLIEFHLKLRVDSKDLCEEFGQSDVLGALYVATRRVYIDSRLDPTADPSLLGRYRFTLAHEASHWHLHRQYFEDAARQETIFAHQKEPPSVVCRSSERKEPIEWQADRHAAYLLMPKDLILPAWKSQFGNGLPTVSAEEYEMIAGESRRLPLRADARDQFEQFEQRLFRKEASKLAPAFEVSTEAMQYRLQQLGLLRRERVRELPLR